MPGGRRWDVSRQKVWLSVRNKLKQIFGASGSSREVADSLSYKLDSTLVSVLIPVYNPVISHLVEALESAANQSHDMCEVIVVNDASTDPDVQRTLERFAAEYSNIVLLNLEKNLGIAGASQAALDRAKGDWVGLLDQDDLLELNAVEVMLRRISNFPNAGLAYSDSDKLDADGTFKDTYLKGDWSPERLRGNMYLAHFTFFRRDLAQSVGGFRSDFDGAQDHDLALRISETKCDVVHTPEVLYHWRISPTSTSSNPDAKPFARDAGSRAINEHLNRIRIAGHAKGIENYPGFYEINRTPSKGAKVSVVIPTRGTRGTIFNHTGSLIIRCLKSISDRPQVTLGEIVLVADQVEDLTYLDKAKELFDEKLKVVMYDKPFNFSEKVNIGISASENEFVLVLNDDIEMISRDWLDPLVALLEQEDVGGVGPLLKFEDGTIQHGGHYYAHGGATHRYLKEQWSPGYFGDLILERESSGLTAAFLLVKKSIWQSVGGFSLELPNNFNDVDFCLKVREQKFRLIFSPRVEAFHFESKTRESTVHWSEVSKITELWGHKLGASRELYGPGGKPKNFAKTQVKSVGVANAIKKIFGNLYYGRRPVFSLDAKTIGKESTKDLFANNYSFKLNFPIELSESIKRMMIGQFEGLVTEFEIRYPKNEGLETRNIQVWVSANVSLGWNLLEQLAIAFENKSINCIYSDYVDSLDSYQSQKALSGWSLERFLGLHYVGRVLAFDEAKIKPNHLLAPENYLSTSNQILLSSEAGSIGRIPNFLYRLLSDPLNDQINLKHQSETLNWIAENRPLLQFDVVEPHIRYKYSSLAAGSCSIIIPTKFSLHPDSPDPIIKECLSSLLEQDRQNLELEVLLVVDRASLNDVNLELIASFQELLDIQIVVFEKKFNFSSKCNLGAARSKGDCLIFLNDDTSWLEKNSLKELVGTLTIPNIGAAGALLRYPNGLIQHGGIIFETPGPEHAYVRQLDAKGSLGDLKVTHDVSAVTGACLAIRRSTFFEVGQWNEKYPGSYNDVDLCARIRSLGYSVVINPNSVLIHFESLSRNPLPQTKDVNRMLDSWLSDLSWERFLRSGDAHGISDQGEQICAPKGQDLSGKYVQYAVYLVKEYGLKAMFTGVYRFLTGTSRRWKSYKKIPSVY